MSMNNKTLSCRAHARLAFSIAAVLGIASCNSGNPSSRLLTDHEIDEGFERLRDRAAILVSVTPSGQADPSAPTEAGRSDVVDDYILTRACAHVECGYDPVTGESSHPDACSLQICQNITAHICAAHLLMEIADHVGEPYSVSVSGDERILFPRQSVAAQAQLAEWAAEEARVATFEAENYLESALSYSQLGECGGTSDWGASYHDPSGSSSESLVRAVAMFFVEGAEMAREATLKAVDLNVDLADAYFSEQVSSAEAARYALTSPTQSRAHAAHLLVGGDEGLYNLIRDEDGAVAHSAALCTSEPLSTTERQALSVLRAAGVAPADVANLEGITTPDLLTSTALATGSVRARLSEYGSTSYALTTSAFLRQVGLSLEDFQVAREYLADERRAFARSVAKMLPAEPLPGGGATTHRRYAGTAGLPRLPPSVFYTTLARYASDAPTDYDTTRGPTAGTVGSGLTSFLEYARGAAARLTLLSTDNPDPILGQMHGPLGAYVGSLTSVEGRLNVVGDLASVDRTITVRFSYDDEGLHGRLRLVFSEDALRCLVDGTVDGAACSVQEYLPLAPLFSHELSTPQERRDGAGYTYRTEWKYEYNGARRVYLVALKSGSDDGSPGSYEPLTGMWTWPDSPGYGYTASVAPEIDSLAARILQPSESWCTHPRHTCADTSFDERIPLENELNDDGDSVETSWRTYLALARQAANEADELGERVIQSGLELDMRAEAAEAELEQLCGATIDISGIFDDDHAIVGGTCDGDADCGSQSICRAGVCFRGASELPMDADSWDGRFHRLDSCLGGSGTVDMVALGDRQLCVWRDGDEVCGGAPGMPCPRIADSTDCATELDPPPDGLTWEPTTHRLNYFSADLTFSSARGGAPPCEELRLLRTGGPDERTTALRTIVGSRFFEMNRVRRIASQIGWRAQPNNTSVVLLDENPWFGTGDTFEASPRTSWPCGAPPMERNCSGAASTALFCSQVASYAVDGQCDIGRASSVAAFNRRTARAVVAARVLTDTGPSGIFAPYFRYYSDNPEAAPSVINARYFNGATVGMAEPWTLQIGESSDADAPDGVSYCYSTSSARYDPLVAPHLVWHTPGAPATEYQEARCARHSTSPMFTVFDMGANTDWDSAADGHMAQAAKWFGGLGASPQEYLRRSESGMVVSGGVRGVLDDLVSGASTRTVVRAPGNSTVSALLAAEPDNNFVSLIESSAGVFQELTYGEVLDGLELICEAGRESVSSCSSTPPRVESAADLGAAQQHVECAAAAIEDLGARAIAFGLPEHAVDALRQESAIGAFPATGGAYAQSIAKARQYLATIASLPGRIASEMRLLENAIHGLRLSVERNNLQDSLRVNQLVSTISDRTTQCATAAAEAASMKGALSGKIAAAAPVCLNSAIQIALAISSHLIEDDISDIDEQMAFAQLRDRLESHSATIAALNVELTQSLDGLDSTLAQLESDRQRSRRLVAQAAFLDSESLTGAHYSVNSASSVMRRRFNTNLERYQRARRDAVRMAYLAKRAIEQRLGVRLGEIRDDLTLVEAPSQWEARLCELEGINYRDIRSFEWSDPGSDFAGSYASQYIGDYVTNLERLVESYRLDYPFQQGADQAVVSIRDDVQGVRAVCPTPVRNLLHHAGQLDVTQGEHAWGRYGCRQLENGDEYPNCVGASPIDGSLASSEVTPFYSGSPFVFGTEGLSSARGYRVSFGNQSRPGEACSQSTEECGLTVDSELSQAVELDAGRYRVSWYGAPVAAGSIAPRSAVAVRDEGGAEIVSIAQAEETDCTPDPMQPCSRWRRYWAFFDLNARTLVRVGVVPVRGAVEQLPQEVDVAGLMLEDVTREVLFEMEDLVGWRASEAPPVLFSNTGETLTRSLPTCEDSSGGVFRSGWRYSCAPLCEDGFGSCADSARRNYCYWETQFSVSQRDIEAGALFASSGFARGNFNYRVDTIGLNFVGSRVRDCSENSSPSTCYSSGYVPYSIEHIGPYTVRNHQGEDYDAPLFTGRIEHARGLAAERYLTNPLSSTDRALIEPYMRRELRGRPLDGTYVIRVWDEEGFNFHGIEDVQVVLNYAYWTRTD